MKRLAILGCTGSIGVTTLDIVARFPERFEVVAVAAGKNVERLAEQVRRFRPGLVAVGDGAAAAALRRLVPEYRGEVICGAEGLTAVATASSAELVVSALVGALGLVPTLHAIAAGKHVALANKEVLVVAGELVTRAAQAAGVNLFPLDSEHNAIFQALRGHRRDEVRRIILTASGGPFLHRPLSELRAVTREDALRHPTWKMGDKITIDSATLMNKGLEVIEAHWLFGLPPERIAVVIHPQSIVHSMVEYIDGSVLAQMGIPDMSIPISYILAYPDRLPLDYLPSLDLPRAATLQFAEPDLSKFVCLALAYRALRAGGTVPAVLNAANEVVVEAFLAGAMAFLDIPRILTQVLDAHVPSAAKDLETLLAADRWARAEARSHLHGSGAQAAAV
ncbi:MAG TPA: 1-deoxy-D-xylulose-5-phosphate reductoisomerase [Candidatus Acidoferrales bacterium]|nr:1-deoxy-D-xylulose-5-phosphate reductoisomerase [Candidatus Acidoferrales bacterium]